MYRLLQLALGGVGALMESEPWSRNSGGSRSGSPDSFSHEAAQQGAGVYGKTARKEAIIVSGNTMFAG